MPEANSHHRSIFHPTDLTADSRTAFLHALRLAVAAKARLSIMHVGDEEEPDQGTLPQVRETLKRWGMITRTSDDAELKALGLGVVKRMAQGADPLETCVAHLEHHTPEMIVLYTHQREGRMSWLVPRMAEPLARRTHAPTLFIPHGRRGFVDAVSGSVRLRRILVPIAAAPSPQRAIGAAVQLARSLAEGPVTFTLLHVDDGTPAPETDPPHREGWTWERRTVSGEVAQAIVDAAGADTDLIAMATAGHDGFLDALRGSTTERVLRLAACPLLATSA
ncbi:MAG: universal stress protein [Flavobacteriales bacterium]|nr:universal stress protein [Flavobacteriales bacterium]MCB9166903.1 universal stress protein [Flavobacteriales bacterium]MCB9182247.1 universal stress protein [Flavobacteriales bacterium]